MNEKGWFKYEFVFNNEKLQYESEKLNTVEKMKLINDELNEKSGELKLLTKDNFKLILNYSPNCYSQFTEDSEKKDLEVSGFVMAELHIDGDVKVKGELNTKFEVGKDISGLVNNKVTTDDIYNGFIKSKLYESKR